uniref:Uncharacterized protein n=1 Tax=Arundo donax TaxID=35708 RepID=A0A0A9CP54_ARUDO
MVDVLRVLVIHSVRGTGLIPLQIPIWVCDMILQGAFLLPRELTVKGKSTAVLQQMQMTVTRGFFHYLYQMAAHQNLCIQMVLVRHASFHHLLPIKTHKIWAKAELEQVLPMELGSLHLQG